MVWSLRVLWKEIPGSAWLQRDEDFDPGNTNMIRLTVKTLQGNWFKVGCDLVILVQQHGIVLFIKVTVHKDATLREVKEAIEREQGILPVDQRLIWVTSMLADDRTCSDYNIQNGALLALIVRLRGIS